VLQTHFTYAYQTVAVTATAVVAFVVHRRGDRRLLIRPLALTAGVSALCWMQPLWDQLRGTANLAAVLDQSGGSDRSVGVSRGLRILAETVFVPPFAAPGSMGDLLRRGPRPSPGAAVLALAAWLILLVSAAVWMRHRHRGLAALAGIAAVGLAGSVLAVVKIPPTEQFGIIAQNYYWAWPIGMFATVAVAGSALRELLAAVRVLAGRQIAHDGVALVLAAVTALAAVPLLRPTNLLPETDHEWSVSRHLARPLVDDLGMSLDELDVAGPVLVDLGAVRHVRYTLLVELQRRGIDFVFAAGSTDLSRFGRERCDDGGATLLLSLRGGSDAVQLRRSGWLLATVPGLSGAQARRAAELAESFGEALRDGSVVVDSAVVADLGGEVPAVLAQVLATADMPASGLGAFLGDWEHFGAVSVADGLLDALAEWRALERASTEDRMAIYLQPIAGGRPDLCAAIAPGPTVAPR
jgi:hypothetical protein